MQAGPKIVLKTVSVVVLLGAILLVAAVSLDKDMNAAFQALVDEQINEMVADHSQVRNLVAERDAQRQLVQRLTSERDALNAELQQLSRELETVTGELETATRKADDTRNELSSEFDRLKSELDREVASREIAIEQVREKFAVIRVGDKVLFDTGKSDLKPRGKEVLGLIADSLKKFPGREVRVEGHTDNLPIVSNRTRKKYPTNWELSSARATSAVRYLIEQGGLDPQLLAAVGHGEHEPVASNDTPEGRSRNRRIEIILMPSDDSFKIRDISHTR